MPKRDGSQQNSYSKCSWETKAMSQIVYDLDGDSDEDIQEMTAAQIKDFKKKEKSQKAQKKSQKKSKSKAKKSKSKTIEKQKKGKSNRASKRKSVSPEQRKEKKKQKPNKKIESNFPDNLLDRWSRQPKESQVKNYGNATFIDCVPSKFHVKAKETLRSGVTWWLDKGDYLQCKWELVFAKMVKMNARDLRIINSRYPTIIKQIFHVRFESLEILYLYENNIKSIELLCRMRFPFLKDLSLRDNFITNLRTFNRMGLQNLQHLSLTENYIIDMSWLCSLNTNSLKDIYLDWKTSTHVNGQDISWLAKLKKNPDKTSTMQSIVVQSKYRLPQHNVDVMLAQKYRKPLKSFIKRGIN